MAGLPVPAPRPPINSKQQTPQQAIDEFWGKFTTKTPGKATTIIPHNKYAERAARRSAKAIGTNTQTSYEEAAAVCKAKVAKIAKECRRVNQKYRDPHFDLEFDLKWGSRDTLESLNNQREKPSSDFKPKSVKRVVDIFDDPKFYIEGPTANDVRQGRDGDCWLLAALCTLSNKPGLIEKLCVARDEQVGVYGFVFYRDGEWISEIIDDKLFLTKPDFDESFLERMLWEDRERINSEEQYRRTYQSGSGALYFAQCEHENETWLPLLEKAYSKAHGDYSAIEGGYTGEGIEDLTGGVTSELYTTDILDKEYFWREELMKVNNEFLFGCSTGMWGVGWGDRKGIIELHAYSVMKAVEINDLRLIQLKNPWGKDEWKGAWSDGSKEWTAEWLLKLNYRFGDDGNFWISYDDLLRKYQAFDRTRLFGPEWKITSLWTTLSVPWTLDYHDTYFTFSLAKTGPVVIVLSQLDDRYYRGLEGQYRFELNFRLHRNGQEDYVVRSTNQYCQNRSVNVELELEAGEYDVLFLCKARRINKLPIEEVVRGNARDRRDKLVTVGMSYDLAHSKGKIIETPGEKITRKEADKRRTDREKRELKEDTMRYRYRQHYLRVKDHNKAQKKKARVKAKRAEKAKANAKARKGHANSREQYHPGSKEQKYVQVFPQPKRWVKLEERVQHLEHADEDDCSSVSSVISSVSEFSDASVDSEFDRRAGRNPAQRPAPPYNHQHDDEFESSPWNAMATVGLRVYYKVSDEDKDKEIVKLRVVRPNPYARDSEDEYGDDESEFSGYESEFSGYESEVEKKPEEPIGFKGLDVDDSSKDATLEGNNEQRQKSILSLVLLAK
ncbi:hypothetical protein M426DRAFT_13201 [Hypoxylon sp. CI-4A]|nr:hypothetical protein M426DRAFT_13201 [Hypoxylon sp. CI-4A]